jgi:Flp pilus assembly protein TadD
MAARIRGGEGFAPQVRRELEAATVAAPDEPLPQLRLAELERDPDVRRARAEALVQEFPRSAEARVFLARVLRDGGGPVEGRQAAALAAVTAAPDDVDALTAHAIEEMRAGNAAGALRSVARAEQLEPWNPTVFVARALVLSAIGLCEEAVDAVQRALDVLPDNPPPTDVQALVRERERIARSCPRAGP